MQTEKEAFLNSIKTLDAEPLRDICLHLYEQNQELRNRQSANEKINTETYIQYSQLHEKCQTLEKENADLKDLLQKEIQKNQLGARSTFGRKTEAMLALLEEAGRETCEFEDESPTEEEACRTVSDLIQFAKGIRRKKNTPASNTGKRQKTNRLARSLQKLPKELIYDIDIRKLNEKYGENNWRIAFWHEHPTLEKLDSPFYERLVYTPVISVGLEHRLITQAYENQLIDRSLISPSIAADLFYRKFVLSLPCNRQAKDYQMQGIDLTKQNIINWMAGLVPKIFEPVADYLAQCLVRYKYTQNDETYIQVNKDEHGAGHKSFLWVHCSSELADCDPIVVFCYEATRNTDHLRDFYKEFMGYITCDAYVSYKVLEAENPDSIKVTGCLMHCRRHLAEAFFLNDITGMSEEAVRELPETKALLMIRDIYREENLLKDLTAEERKNMRDQKVRPLVDQFFSYIHLLDQAETVYSDRMRKAITYAVNQEKYLREFLNDGNIPCDNGNSERKIRAYSIGRANWLFADTIYGAELNATMYSVVETAKANGVNVLLYLRYLLEEMPGHRMERNQEYLKDMVPWCDSYRKYEQTFEENRQARFQKMFPEPVKPKTPKKKGRHLESPGQQTA